MPRRKTTLSVFGYPLHKRKTARFWLVVGLLIVAGWVWVFNSYDILGFTGDQIAQIAVGFGLGLFPVALLSTYLQGRFPNWLTGPDQQTDDGSTVIDHDSEESRPNSKALWFSASILGAVWGWGLYSYWETLMWPIVLLAWVTGLFGMAWAVDDTDSK